MPKVILSQTYMSETVARLQAGIDFYSTPEGYEFWDAIRKRMNRYGSGYEDPQPIWQKYDMGIVTLAVQRHHQYAQGKLPTGQEDPLIKAMKEQIAILSDEGHKKDQEIGRIIAERDTLKKRLRIADWANHRV